MSALAGYIALSQEIVWYRLIAFASGGSPTAFAHLLGCFLLGVGLGAAVGDRLTRTSSRAPSTLVAALFAGSALIGYFTIPSTANAFLLLGDEGIYYAYLSVTLVAIPGGVLFPVLSHEYIRGSTGVGASLSYLYLANVAGATCGPLITTFVLMDRMPLASLSALLAAVAFAAAVLGAIVLRGTLWGRGAAVALSLLAAGGTALASEGAYASVLEKLHFKKQYAPQSPYREVVQNRSGIVTVGGSLGARSVFGDGVYDGTFNLDPVVNDNGIQRAFQISALHRAPSQVLNIGLGTGSWAWVLAADPAVKRQTIVEINPGYVELIRRFPDHAELFSDPDVELIIDDGRRWLNRHPESVFDLIVMNTTMHWRQHASDLLSEDFFRQCKSHLKPGGVLFLNSTGAEEVPYTLARVFRHVVAVEKFFAGSDAPFDMSVIERAAALRRFTAHGKPLLSDADPEQAAVLEHLARVPLRDLGDELRARTDLTAINDDNMWTEFIASRPRRNDGWSWSGLFQRLSNGR